MTGLFLAIYFAIGILVVLVFGRSFGWMPGLPLWRKVFGIVFAWAAWPLFLIIIALSA